MIVLAVFILSLMVVTCHYHHHSPCICAQRTLEPLCKVTKLTHVQVSTII